MNDDFAGIEDMEIKPYVERDKSEFKIQCAIIDHLRGRTRRGREEIKGTMPFPGLFVTHVYQGRSKEEGFFLKMLGVVSGVPDLLLLWPDKAKGYDIAFLEVKAAKGFLTTPQRKFQGYCHSLGIKWAVARSVAEAHKQVKAWGVTIVHDAIKEPDTRTWQQKTEDAMAFYRPAPKD